MKILDCESIDSIYASLESILGIKRPVFESVFDSIDLDVIYKSQAPLLLAWETIRRPDVDRRSRLTGLDAPLLITSSTEAKMSQF